MGISSITLLSAVLTLAACKSADFSGQSSRPQQKPAAPAPGPQKPQGPSNDAKPQKPNSPAPGPSPSDGKDDANADDGNDIFVPPSNPPPPPPPPQNAVVQGSFTVYTLPADPAPGQNYSIIIEVKLPSNITSIDKNDLSGRVIGTDGYTQNIGSSADIFDAQDQRFTFVPGRATLTVPVPGALDFVRDTIEVRSRALNEGQTITITF